MMNVPFWCRCIGLLILLFGLHGIYVTIRRKAVSRRHRIAGYIGIIGALLMIAGTASNCAVVASNQGRMPVLTDDPGQIERLETSKDHSLLTPKTHLPLLADIFETRNLFFSIGDLAGVVGILGTLGAGLMVGLRKPKPDGT